MSQARLVGPGPPNDAGQHLHEGHGLDLEAVLDPLAVSGEDVPDVLQPARATAGQRMNAAPPTPARG